MAAPADRAGLRRSWCGAGEMGRAEMIDSGDTAWILVSTALVLLMTPGLAFFYGGLVRGKNVGGTIMHSFITVGVVGVVWLLFLALPATS